MGEPYAVHVEAAELSPGFVWWARRGGRYAVADSLVALRKLLPRRAKLQLVNERDEPVAFVMVMRTDAQ
jgi:hypothetical protein